MQINGFFKQNFLNPDISPKNTPGHWKFGRHINEIHLKNKT